MAVPANFDFPEHDKFRYCYTKILSFVYKDDESSRTDINLLLDQLNSLEFSSLLVREQDGNKLLTKLCSLIPLHEERLVVKLCQITNNLKRKQMLILLENSIQVVVDYFVKAIHRCHTWTRPDILRALASVIFENCHRVTQFHDKLLGKEGIFIQMINDDVTDMETLIEAVFCMECLTTKPPSPEYLSSAHVEVCFDVFTMLLHKMPGTKMDQIAQCRILINCLRGIQNLLQVTQSLPIDRLGVILAAVRCYMFYGLYSQPTVIPESLYPSPLTKHDITTLGTLADKSGEKTANEEDNSAPKKSKRKTKKKTDKREDKKEESNYSDDHDPRQDALVTMEMTPGIDFDLKPTWAKISSSESEWSDTEGGQVSKLRSSCTKVRQCALACFYWIVKTTDKKLMFSYWSSFIPDCQSTTNLNNTQTLFTIILKDPSPKCRMGALAALSALVDGTKLLLSAAEDIDDTKTSTFTPFSVILGSIIQEIHRCLLQAMVSEDYPITLTQLIKCFGTVISNVPYHRMRPGLLSRIVKQIRHFINHRDANVRVACLTCLGAMAKIQPPLMEVCHIIHPARPPVSTRIPSVTTEADAGLLKNLDTIAPGLSANSNQAASDLDSGFCSSPNVGLGNSLNLEYGSQGNSGVTTPQKGMLNSPGVQTPVFSDQLLQAHAKEISWVVKLCVRNILPQSVGDGMMGSDKVFVERLPVRLESLQVLANLTKGYFPIIRNCVPLLKELILSCYCDEDPVVKLHTAKLLDEFTQVLLQDLQAKDVSSPAIERLDKQQVLDFWLALLNGPVQEILQNPKHGAVRVTTCDCIANIGDKVFTSLPFDKRVMCLTVVLGLTGEDDRFIRASAIRTLGVYVLYKSLREDVSFITDSTTAILSAMDDKNISVRVKTVWSLANLCSALALNREEGDTEFLEEFSDILVLSIITMATRACMDSDKVKANGVRALGNILRYLSAKCLGKEMFNKAVIEGVKALVKNVGSGAMKVRWNACYAISNLYKNTDLSSGSASWNAEVQEVLCSVVKDCKNFKVRINAAIAISSPRERRQYGETGLYVRVWRGVIEAFSTAEDIVDFIDYRYRDNLVEQISVCVLHLVSLLQAQDLEPLYTVLQSSGDQLLSCMDKYATSRQRTSEIDLKLSQAMTNLERLKDTCLPEGDQSICVQIMTTMCSQLTTATDTGAMKAHPKPVFAPTYD